MHHDFLYSLIDVFSDLVESFANMCTDSLVVKFISPQLMVLQLLHGLAQAINLSSGLFLVHFDVLLDIHYTLVDLFSLVLQLSEGLAGLAKWVLLERLLADEATFDAMKVQNLLDLWQVVNKKAPAWFILDVHVSGLRLYLFNA